VTDADKQINSVWSVLLSPV